jgi:hypothetical protein
MHAQALKETFGKLRALRRFFDLCEQGGCVACVVP